MEAHKVLTIITNSSESPSSLMASEASSSSPASLASSFLPTGSLVEALIHISNQVSSMDKLPVIQSRNIATIVRRIKLLSTLFEEIRETTAAFPPSSILCLTELFSVIRRVKLLVQEIKEGSSLWSLVQTEYVSKQFHLLARELGKALDILPLSLLHVNSDVREQVELLHKHAKRAELFVDP